MILIDIDVYVVPSSIDTTTGSPDHRHGTHRGGVVRAHPNVIVIINARIVVSTERVGAQTVISNDRMMNRPMLLLAHMRHHRRPTASR